MEKINNTIEILQAFKEGKTIEHQIINKSDSLCGHWIKTTSFYDILSYLRGEVPIRIAKDPAYRPYVNAEEFLKASKEHGPWFGTKDKVIMHNPDSILFNNGKLYIEGHNYDIKAECMLGVYFWQDGTPCGVLE